MPFFSLFVHFIIKVAKKYYTIRTQKKRLSTCSREALLLLVIDLTDYSITIIFFCVLKLPLSNL